ncbi:hypothetical protein ACP4OV_026211 [Aristida adscensionis]
MAGQSLDFMRMPPQELLERDFHSDQMSSEEKMKQELQRVREGFKMSENDCVSARVQNYFHVYGGPLPHRIFPPPVPPMTSFNDAEVVNDVEKRLSGFNERTVYEQALEHINQEKREENLPEDVMSVSLLKHQKIALAWMISKENSLLFRGGILADDQGLGKTISTIALIQKERAWQSRFMNADSYDTKSELNVDDNDQVILMDKKKLEGLPDKLDNSTLLHAANSLKLCASQPTAVADRMVKAAKVEPNKKKKKVRVNSSASTLRPKTRPAAGTLVVCPASVLKQWANELSVKVTEGAKLSVLVYHGASRTKNPAELATYDVVVTTYATVANEVPIEKSDDEKNNNEVFGISPELSVGSKTKQTPIVESKVKKSKSDGGPLARRIEIVLLRRTKETLIDGEPIIKLPPKTIQLNKIDFTEEERAFYLTLEEGSRQKFKAYDAAGTIEQNYANILVLLLRLRQACVHRVLLKGQEKDLINDASIELAKQLPKETVDNPYSSC